ncbi:MAG TPA: hypothetical protein VKK06_02425 [Terriglobia bacterium]|nr:hypothetical protein [Terriglobia bacterium]
MRKLSSVRKGKVTPLRIVVVGTVASMPYAGMAWMHMQIAAGLRRLGHDVYYMEVSSVWPYDPIRKMKVNDSNYALPYLARVADAFDFADRWAYRRSYSDHEWLGMSKAKAESLLADADLVLNVAGATRIRTKQQLKVRRLVYYGTDPVYHELAFANRDGIARRTIDQHDDFVTYGENIGSPDCPIPSLPRLRSKSRQPVLIDFWQDGPPTRKEFTTVCNWKQGGHDIQFAGETYYWSKDREFMKFIELPKLVTEPIELSMGLVDTKVTRPGFGDLIPAQGMTEEELVLLMSNGWKLNDAHAFTTDPWSYRSYIIASRGEFTVARDQNVRLKSGWFSERSACYLAAGRPVITQDTGFGKVLPTGEGLFAFNTIDDILTAFEAIRSDYDRHSRSALAIANEYFRAETVLAKVIEDLSAE